MGRTGLAVLAALLCASLPAFGVEPPKTYGQAMGWYERAAAEGMAEAQYLLGRLHEDGRYRRLDPVAAAGWYRKAARQGHRLAEFRLGAMLLEGRGVARDPVAARGWFEKAAARDVAGAQFDLGYMLEHGLGGPADPARAEALYRAAAQKGVAQAQYNLGLLLNAKDAPRERRIEAAVWLGRAAANGLTAAVEARDAALGALPAQDRAVAERRMRAPPGGAVP